MNRDVILAAIREGIPFVIEMADGAKYEVVADHQIAVGPGRAFVFKDDIPHLLHLREIVAITYLSGKNSGK